MKYLKRVGGKFGFDDEGMFPCTIWFKDESRMYREEFEKYIFNVIVPLYPNACDV